MNSEKQKKLENLGWTVGGTSDFLGLTSAEAELIEIKIKLALLVKKHRK
ncbi:MAG: hypothetical protein AAGA80_23585 [Cyanobacteria bacterium P01_F01_bin.143]